VFPPAAVHWVVVELLSRRPTELEHGGGKTVRSVVGPGVEVEEPQLKRRTGMMIDVRRGGERRCIGGRVKVPEGVEVFGSGVGGGFTCWRDGLALVVLAPRVVFFVDDDTGAGHYFARPDGDVPAVNGVSRSAKEATYPPARLEVPLGTVGGWLEDDCPYAGRCEVHDFRLLEREALVGGDGGVARRRAY